MEQNIQLSCSFRCGQNYNNHYHEFCHTLLSYLSPTYMFNKATSDQNQGSVQMTSLY
jgi:hypothetical protein